MSRNINVPKLRFKEFSGEWEETKLGTLLTFKNGINASKEQYGSGYKFINVLDIINNNVIFHNNIIGSVNVSKDIFEKNIVEFGDILFQRSSETREEAGQSNVYLDKNIPATFGGFVIRGKAKKEYIPLYMNYMLKTDLARKEITKNSNGSTRYNVGQETLAEVNIFIPQKEEQEKIASFLSQVDSKIEQLTKKEALLEQYKKGVMQKIFSQEIRFKDDDGSDFPEWEKKEINKCIDHLGGTALEKYVSKNYKYKFISIGNYSTDGKYIDNGQRIILNEKTSTKLLYKNDLVMVLNDKTSSGDIIGSTILIKEDDKFIFNQRSERIICNEDILPNYLWHFFNSKQFRLKIYSLAQGGTQIYINFSSVKSIIIRIPCLNEQTKIANFLSAIDNKIEANKKQLDKTKEFKKALLQQMFV